MRVTSAAGKSMEVRLANESSSTVQEILDAVSLEWGVPAARHQLIFRGKALSPAQTLKEAGIADSDEILLRGKMRGGCAAGCHLCGSGAGCRCDIM